MCESVCVWGMISNSILNHAHEVEGLLGILKFTVLGFNVRKLEEKEYRNQYYEMLEAEKVHRNMKDNPV